MKSIHVVPHGKDWAVRSARSERAAVVTPKQSDAIVRGRDMAIRQQTELKIHGRGGQIRESNSYGNDPFPPRG